MRFLAAATLAVCALARASFADSLSTAGSPSPADTFDLDSSFVTGINEITDFRWLPDGRVVILAKTGETYVRPAGGGALVTAGTFSVHTDSDNGLLGLAVDPDFATNHRLYFYYSADASAPVPGTDANRQRVVVRTLSDADQLGPETLLLENLRGPSDHDGGSLEIGTDGLLYIGVGDAGNDLFMPAEPAYTPGNFYPTCLADDPTQFGAGNGKILRIALDGTIPDSNPLVDATNVTKCGPTPATPISPTSLGTPRPEVYAWGFRNPWRIWIDPQTSKLWVADVGDISYEELDIVEPGRHYGWPWREGIHGWPITKCQDVRVGTAAGGAPIQDQDCVDPIYSCRHDDTPGLDQSLDGGCDSITGGQIVDTCSWPAAYRGLYYFADNANGSLWAIPPNAARDGIGGSRIDIGSVAPDIPVSVRTGNDGALYVAVFPGSTVSRIVRIAPKSPVACSTTTTTSPTTTSTSAPVTTTTATSSTSHPITTTTSTSTTIVITTSSSSSTTILVTTTTSPSTTAPSTTLPGSTTTTVAGGTTTTTTLDPCAGLDAAPRFACQLGVASTALLCGGNAAEAYLIDNAHARFQAAQTFVQRADTSPRLKSQKKLFGRADRRLRMRLPQVKRSLRKDATDAACRTEIETLLTTLRQTLASLSPDDSGALGKRM
jgi:glucose/arabinose dehydrogenase